MTAKILKFPEQTELQKARTRMGGDEKLFQGFRESLERAAEEADFVLDRDAPLEPITNEDLEFILADPDD